VHEDYLSLPAEFGELERAFRWMLSRAQLIASKGAAAFAFAACRAGGAELKLRSPATYQIDADGNGTVTMASFGLTGTRAGPVLTILNASGGTIATNT
jgi:hypothetical protein